MKYKENELKQGIKIHTINTNKFKTNLLAIFLTTELNRKTVTKNALISMLLRRGSKNMPTQKAMDMGLFEVKETVFMDGNGVQQTKFTPRVTGKGQIYFLNKYLIMKEKGKAAEA